MRDRMRQLSADEANNGRELNGINKSASDLVEKSMGVPAVKGKGPANPVRTNPKPDKRLASIDETERNLRTIQDNPKVYGKDASDKAKGYLGQIGDTRQRQADILAEKRAANPRNK